MENITTYKLNRPNFFGFLRNENEAEDTRFRGANRAIITRILVYTSIPVLFCILGITLFRNLPHFQESYTRFVPAVALADSSIEPGVKQTDFIKAQASRNKKLDKKYAKFSTSLPYLIVNTSDNTFNLYNSGKLVRNGICSTGSFVLLDAGDGKTWMFETPKGVMHIQGKTESPVWRKPDWAFIEEGLPVPKNQFSYERYEYGAMGDYALSIGNGYLIHGTLYKRLLGMPVTHGCVRLDDADLEQVFRTLRIGSKVYIF